MPTKRPARRATDCQSPTASPKRDTATDRPRSKPRPGICASHTCSRSPPGSSNAGRQACARDTLVVARGPLRVLLRHSALDRSRTRPLVYFQGRRLAAARDPVFSTPDRSGHLLGHARRHPRRRLRRTAPVDAGRHTHQLGETGAERTQRRTPDRETHLGDAEITTTQQGHRPLDPPRHQVAVRRLSVSLPELTAEMPGRHVHPPGKRLHVQRLRVFPVDPIADLAQPRELTQVLRRGWSAGHPRDRATPYPSCPTQVSRDTSPGGRR